MDAQQLWRYARGEMAKPFPSGDTSTRAWLAIAIVVASILSILVLSIVSIATAGATRAATSRLVFSSVLPLLGTWVGTVLAFYFARDSLQAATESTLALTGRELATPVASVMIREADFVAYDLGTDDQVEAIQLTAVRDKMRQLSPPSRRLPIRNALGAVLYVIHDATLAAYAESEQLTADTLTGTIGDLLSKQELKELVTAIGFVSEKATVSDARAKMGSIKNCNDIFVTASGNSSERAIGWLTNTLLAGVQ